MQYHYVGMEKSSQGIFPGIFTQKKAKPEKTANNSSISCEHQLASSMRDLSNFLSQRQLQSVPQGKENIATSTVQKNPSGDSLWSFHVAGW